jgi:hypothetical protein
MVDESTPPPPELDYFDCPACLALPEPPVPTLFRRVERITELVQVRTWPNLVEKTEHKHFVDPGSILAYYVLSQRVVCSLGVHKHKEGRIAVTRCGLVLRLGWQCADRSVGGYEAADAFYKQSEQHFLRLDRIRSVPFNALEELSELVPRIEDAYKYREGKRETAFGREMLRRATSGLPRDAEVTYRTKEFGNSRATDLGDAPIVSVERAAIIEGLSFWTESLEPERCRKALTYAKELAAQARKYRPEDDADDELASTLDGRCKHLELELGRVRAIADLCRKFTNPANLRWATLGSAQAPT